MLEFAAFKIKEVESYGLEALNEKLEFNEEEVLNNNAELFKKLAKLEEIEIAEYNETNKPKGCKDTAIPGKPLIVRATARPPRRERTRWPKSWALPKSCLS